ncbi:MAG: hypothetical protein R2771_04320 [Saprospiraceae bacterium]
MCRGYCSVICLGASTYAWSTGDTISSIYVSETGNYSVVGINENGCTKEDEVSVNVYKVTYSDFNLSPREISQGNSLVSANIYEENDVDYYWDMGDGYSYTGNSITHNYTNLNLPARDM